MDERAAKPEAPDHVARASGHGTRATGAPAPAAGEAARATGGWPRRLDSARVTYEAGRRVQAVALVMLRHQIVPALGICRACGRTPSAELPMFGPRCDIAVTQWRTTWATLHRLLDTPRHDADGRHTTVSERAVPRVDRGTHDAGTRRAAGRSAVPPQK